MRIAALIAALALSVLTGCAGGREAQNAQQLLQQAQAQQLKLRSAAFVVNVDVGVDGQRFGVTMDGAAETRAQKVGDMFLRMRVSGLPAATGRSGGFAATVVKHGQRVTVRAQGRTQTFTATEARTGDFDAFAQLGSFDFASCIERIDVEKGSSLNGEPATRIAGRIDTVCVLKAEGVLGGAPAAAGFDFSELAKHIEDVHATLFVSNRSKLLIGALISTKFEANGQHADFRLSYRLTNVNQPVRIPAGL